MDSLKDWLSGPQTVGSRLRALREFAGLSQGELAKKIALTQSAVSRAEAGKRDVSSAEIEAWGKATGADGETVAALRDMQARARATGMVDFRETMALGQSAQMEDYDLLFGRAVRIRNFETAYVPGLLQIPDYARRVRREMVPLHGLPVDDSDAAASKRVQQQQALYVPGRSFEFIIAEPVLRYLLVPPAVMRGQLDRLTAVIGMEQVRFGIVPMGRELEWTPQHSFQIYDDGNEPVVEVESVVRGPWYRGEDAERFGRFFDLLWTEAVEGDDARALITAAAEALR